jgi:hypothetical protein
MHPSATPFRSVVWPLAYDDGARVWLRGIVNNLASAFVERCPPPCEASVAGVMLALALFHPYDTPFVIQPQLEDTVSMVQHAAPGAV